MTTTVGFQHPCIGRMYIENRENCVRHQILDWLHHWLICLQVDQKAYKNSEHNVIKCKFLSLEKKDVQPCHILGFTTFLVETFRLYLTINGMRLIWYYIFMSPYNTCPPIHFIFKRKKGVKGPC